MLTVLRHTFDDPVTDRKDAAAAAADDNPVPVTERARERLKKWAKRTFTNRRYYDEDPNVPMD